MRIRIRVWENIYVIEIQNDIKKRELKQKYIRASPFGFFIYRGTKLDDNERVCDYGIKENNVISYYEVVGAGGPLPTTHISPYGCGRQIPDDYKGCTELLQAKPNYFG